MDAGLEALTGPHLWRGWSGCSAPAVRPTGFAALDEALGGGWPWGAIVEIFVSRYGSGELGVLMPALASLCEADEAEPGSERGLIVWVAPPLIPYPPALVRHGIDAERLLVVQTRLDAAGRAANAERDTLWALEQAVRSGASAAVIAWLAAANDTVLRRLQLAAEERHCGLVLFRPERTAAQRSPAALRLKISAEEEGTRVEVLKRRGGGPCSLRLDLGGLPGNSA